MIESGIARVVAILWYVCTIVLCRVFPPRRSTRAAATGRIVVTGTFHNPGWFVSHTTPLARCGLREVIVVSHGPLPHVEGVRLYSPPSWLTALAGRTLSKLVWTLHAGLRFKPDAFMGYHIIPNSTTALIAGRLLGRPVCYQMTSGPIEIVGGGYRCSENPILRRLGGPSPRIERLAFQAARMFDLVVVRGAEAERFMTEQAGCRRVAIIPGSVDARRFGAKRQAERTCDAVFVGQLVSRKQPLVFVEAIASVHRRMPRVRAAVVGDGPLRPEVRRLIADRGLLQVIDVFGQSSDVRSFLTGSRVFVLPSLNEGLSIAMAEAMIAGAVPVVANVGDLKDLIQDGKTGYLVEPDNVEMYADRILRLLRDPAHCERLSRAASEAARNYNGLERIATLWGRHLEQLGATSHRHRMAGAHPVHRFGRP